MAEARGRDLRTRRARAGEAVSRVRLRRAINRRKGWLGFAGLFVPLVPSLIVAALWLAAHALGFDDFLSSDEVISYVPVALFLGAIFTLLFPLLVAALLLGAPGGLVVLGILWLLGTGPGAFAGVMLLGLAVIGAAALVVRGARYRATRRRAEAALVRDGELPAEWPAPIRKELAEADDALELTDAGAVRPAVDTAPPESCPRCAASLSLPGAGLRRCEYCGFERYDDLPQPEMALTSARELFLVAKKGKKRRAAAAEEGQLAARATAVLPVARRDLWRTMLETHGKKRGFRRIAFDVGLLVGYGLLLDGLALLGVDPLAESAWSLLTFGPLLVLGMYCSYDIAMGLFEDYDLRFHKFMPGAWTYDLALLTEIVRAVAYKGRATKGEVAEHLGIRRQDLDEVLVNAERYGGAPFYHDCVHDELIGLQAYEAGDNRCLACGGELEVKARGRMQCGHCGSHAVGAVA